MSTSERRHYPRFHIRLPLKGEIGDGQSISFVSGDVSLGGIACFSPHHIPEMTKMDMNIELPVSGGTTRIHVEGVVVRVDPSEPSPECRNYRIALFFTNLTDHARRELLRFLAEHAAAKGGDGRD